MIFTYGTSLQGVDHKRLNIPCQDAHRIKTLPNGWVIAAVADGVGSALYSEYGSKVAVDTVINFCVDNMPFTCGVVSAESDLIPLLRVAYNKAYKNIWELAESQGNDFKDYDTTLDVVIYNGNNIIYGHCSDGGIIALNDNGYYDCVTERMKGEDGESMIPLRFREKWEFGIYQKSSSSILLFTDGIYDFARQDFLEKNWEHPLYIPLLIRMSNTNFLPKRSESWEGYFDSFTAESFWKEQVSDDRTFVTLINLNKTSTLVESSYYEEPDWAEIMKLVNKRLYGLDLDTSYTEEDSNNESLLTDSPDSFNLNSKDKSPSSDYSFDKDATRLQDILQTGNNIIDSEVGETEETKSNISLNSEEYNNISINEGTMDESEKEPAKTNIFNKITGILKGD